MGETSTGRSQSNRDARPDKITLLVADKRNGPSLVRVRFHIQSLHVVDLPQTVYHPVAIGRTCYTASDHSLGFLEARVGSWHLVTSLPTSIVEPHQCVTSAACPSTFRSSTQFGSCQSPSSSSGIQLTLPSSNKTVPGCSLRGNGANSPSISEAGSRGYQRLQRLRWPIRVAPPRRPRKHLK